MEDQGHGMLGGGQEGSGGPGVPMVPMAGGWETSGRWVLADIRAGRRLLAAGGAARGERIWQNT